MELRFIKQRYPDGITQLDEIELVNCDSGSGYTNGCYTIADVKDDGEITLVGQDNSSTAGIIAVVHLD